MKRIAFVAHDPGSCDVLYPVYERLRDRAVFLTVGPSADKHPEFFAEDWESALRCLADGGTLTGVVMGRDWGTDIDARLIAWAHARHVKTVVLLDYWSNYASPFCNKGTACWPDAYLVMDELAKEILEQNGVDYLNLTPPEDVIELFPTVSFPTSFFFDSEGRMIVEPIRGALIDQYLPALNAALEQLSVK